ncbi:MAG: TatA/E family twin arginine-targeting protein translocase [Cyanobacteriota bacterium]|jgi:sec-independent protein translocase protein TatA
MNIFGIGLPEMAVIAAIALLVFGPKRLPEMGKTLGRTLRGFQTASQEFEQEFRSALRTEESATVLPSAQAMPEALAPGASAASTAATGLDATPIPPATTEDAVAAPSSTPST